MLKRLVLFGLLILGLALRAQEVKDGAKVLVRIENLENRKGDLLIALFESEDDFPTLGKHDYAARIEIPKEGVVSHTFLVKPGTYVAAIVHDENKSGKMDKNYLGVPTEGYGFSKNEFAMFGMPPDFGDAAFYAEKGKTEVLRINLRY